MASEKVTDSSFEADVLKSSEPVLVDFWAEGCGPCRMIAPALEGSTEMSGSVKVAAQHRRQPAHRAGYGVRSIPTLILPRGSRPPTCRRLSEEQDGQAHRLIRRPSARLSTPGPGRAFAVSADGWLDFAAKNSNAQPGEPDPIEDAMSDETVRTPPRRIRPSGGARTPTPGTAPAEPPPDPTEQLRPARRDEGSPARTLAEMENRAGAPGDQRARLRHHGLRPRTAGVSDNLTRRRSCQPGRAAAEAARHVAEGWPRTAERWKARRAPDRADGRPLRPEPASRCSDPECEFRRHRAAGAGTAGDRVQPALVAAKAAGPTAPAEPAGVDRRRDRRQDRSAGLGFPGRSGDGASAAVSRFRSCRRAQPDGLDRSSWILK
jgi:thioredoxin 1